MQKGLRTPSSPLPPSPSKLCAFCDEPFPLKPSRYLKNILQSLLSKSWPAPRPSNPLGRDAPLAVSINLCTAHRAESATIPAGVRQGWPLKIDFNDVKRRVESDRIRGKLKAILLDKVKSAHGGQRGIFWDAARRDVEVRGARVANSVQGQMQTFEETQPGYYGEKGFLVISSTLQAMFPSEKINPGMTYPLEPSDFLRRVLLPEAAVLLIMEDLKVEREDALAVLKESRTFGLAAFPVRDGETDVGNVSFGMTLSPMVARTVTKEKGKQRANDEDEWSTGRPVSPTLRKGKGKATSKDDRVFKSSSAWLLEDEEEQEQDSRLISRTISAKPSWTVTARGQTKKVKTGEASISHKKNVFDQSSSESDGGPANTKAKGSSKRGELRVAKSASSFGIGNGDHATVKVASPPASKSSTRYRAPAALPPVSRTASQKRDGDDLGKKHIKAKGGRPITLVTDTDEEEYLRPVTIPVSKPGKKGGTAPAGGSTIGPSATKVMTKNAKAPVRHPTATSAQCLDSPDIERSRSLELLPPEFSKGEKKSGSEEHIPISSPEDRAKRKDRKRYKEGNDDGENLDELRQLTTQYSSYYIPEETAKKRFRCLTKLRATRKKK